MAAAARKRSCYLLHWQPLVSTRRCLKEVSIGWVTVAFLRARKRRRMIFNLQKSGAQSRLFIKESSPVSWSAIVGRVFWKYWWHSGQFWRTMDCVTRKISVALKAKTESMNTSIKSSGSIAGWRLVVLGKTIEGGSTTKIAWNKLDACGGLQWSSWGLSWWRISRQRTLHWMWTCWLHGANISVSVFQDSPFPSFHQKQTQNPAVKFSTLLVHWVQNYSNTWL